MLKLIPIYLRICTLTLLVASMAAYGGRNEVNPAVINSEGPTADCYPAPDSSQSQYIIGYGSLLEEKSRKRQDPNADDAFPIRVLGFERGWFLRGREVGASTTYLGARPTARANLNGAAFRLSSPDVLPAYDQREKYYCREAVPAAQIQALNTSRLPEGKLPEGQYWIYTLAPHKVPPRLPDSQYPIVQSYVDLFLAGCFQLQDAFELPDYARECVTSTSDWSRYWVNDRLYPRRPNINNLIAEGSRPGMARHIDRLLYETAPGYFNQMIIKE